MVSRTFVVVVSLSAMLGLFGLSPSRAMAGPLPSCPPLLTVSQSAQSPSKDFTQVPYSGSQRLSRITFRLSTDPGELRPDDEHNTAGRRTFIWNVEGLKGLEQVCEYTGTLVRLVRPVRGSVKRCEVEINSPSKGVAAMSSRCD
jgi:hypothetical protein